jgi:hypothetical protein
MMEPIIFTSDITPEQRRQLAKELLSDIKGLPVEDKPYKKLANINGREDWVYNLAAVRMPAEAIIAASDETLLATHGMDITEVMDMFVFCN